MKVKIPERGGLCESVQGRDKGKLYAIYSVNADCVFVVDGKSRKSANPKKKNVKHLRLLPANIADAGIKFPPDGAFDDRVAYLIKHYANPDDD